MLYSELLARPGESLFDHLESVSNLAKNYASPPLHEAARLAGLTHDIGKATTFFQKYISQERKFDDHPTTRVHHAYLSALFAAWVAKQWNVPYALHIFLSVARHHQALCSPEELLASDKYLDGQYAQVSHSIRHKLRDLEFQLMDLDRPDFYELCEALSLPDPRPFLKNNAWKKIIADLYKEAEYISIENRNRAHYWTTNRIFSALIDADKKQAAEIQLPERKYIPADLVDRYIQSLTGDSPLNPLRNRLYKEVALKIKTMPIEKLFPAILTLTAPTGSGKTLTAFNAALKLRARLESELRISPRIIYVLPYINLIEQTYNEFQKVLKGILSENGNENAYLIEHHHLASQNEKIINDEEIEKYSLEDRFLLVESWDSEVIVTTFVQFFQTLISCNNRSLKKFHNIINSIIILDEVQNIKAEYWPLIYTILEDLKQLGTTIILMTATQPKLINHFTTSEELAPFFPNWPTRVKLNISHIENLEDLAEEVSGETSRSKLFVFNTIPESIKFYKLLKKKNMEPLFYLSTNITPYERELRIKEIRQHLNNEEAITLVSTQVVEAGMDLNFDQGYREIGPLDGIIQVAGRVNRNGSKKEGLLKILYIEGAREDSIYGHILPACTKKFLPPSCNEQDLTQILNEYFSCVESRISQESAREILDAIEHLRYQGGNNSIMDFKLIDEKPTQPIYVELNKEASKLLQIFQRILKEKNTNKKRNALRLLYPRLQRFIINPLLPRAIKNLPPPLFPDNQIIDGEIRHIMPKEISIFYDVNKTFLEGTGFKWDDDINESQFIQ